MLKIFQTKQVRNKIFYTLMILILFQIGTYLTLPGVTTISHHNDSGFLHLVNLTTGSSIQRVGFLALGVSPYITASIVIQMFSKGLIPYYTNLSEQGRLGQQKIAQHTRYYTLLIGLFEAGTLMFSNQFFGFIAPQSLVQKIFLIIILAVGGLFSSYLGELIDEKGIGNGQSMIIAVGVLLAVPQQLLAIYDLRLAWENNIDKYYISVVAIAITYIVVLTVAYWANKKEYHLPLQSMTNNINIQAHYFPIKLLTGSVMPVIFATSVFSILSVIETITESYWELARFTNYKGLLLYIGLIFVFSYLFNLVQVDGERIQKELKESSMYIKNVSLTDTATYITKKVINITNYGAPLLAGIAGLAVLVNILTPVQFDLSLTGVSLLILIGVWQEFIYQAKGLTQKNNYKGVF